MNLSKHFKLAEFTRSQTATRHGIDNEPTPAVLDNLRRLCVQVLEPAREACGGKPIRISSGFRSPQLNTRIGGSKNSRHMLGLAADFEAVGLTLQEAAEAIVSGGVEFNRLIVEYPPDGWLHIEVEPRGEMPARGLAVIDRGKFRWIAEVGEAFR